MASLTAWDRDRKHPPQPPGRGPEPKRLTEAQREALPKVWATLLMHCSKGAGLRGGELRAASLAAQFIYPKAWREADPVLQQFAERPDLRPWSSAGEREVLRAVIASTKWDDARGAQTVQRSIASLATQLGCDPATVKRALRRLRDSPFPVLKITNTPARKVAAGVVRAGVLRFDLVADPLAFAAARDEARATTQATRRAAQHPQHVQLQIDEFHGRLDAAAVARQQRALAREVKWGPRLDRFITRLAAPAVTAPPPPAPPSTPALAAVPDTPPVPADDAAPAAKEPAALQLDAPSPVRHADSTDDLNDQLPADQVAAAFDAVCQLDPLPPRAEDVPEAWALFQQVTRTDDARRDFRRKFEFRLTGARHRTLWRFVPFLRRVHRDQQRQEASRQRRGLDEPPWGEHGPH